MRWFGRKAARAPARPQLTRTAIAWLGLATNDAPKSYETLVREGYERNAFAQRAVRIVAESAGSAPIGSSEGYDKALALIAGSAGGRPLVESIATSLILHGNAYVQAIADGDGQPAELIMLRPERVSVEQGGDGWPVAHRRSPSTMPQAVGTGRCSRMRRGLPARWSMTPANRAPR